MACITLNRTRLELKPSKPSAKINLKSALNRTRLELKLAPVISGTAERGALNRTRLELKRGKNDYLTTLLKRLIAPDWN